MSTATGIRRARRHSGVRRRQRHQYEFEDELATAALEVELEQAAGALENTVERENALDGLAPVPGIENTSQAFRLKVIRIAQSLNTDPNFLMAIMSFESDGFDPARRNAQSGATGLIQFMPTTARELGTTTDALARMTAEQQLDYVAKYFAPYKGRLNTLEDTYMAVLWPKAIGQGSNYVLFSSPSIAYQQNQALDLNKDGKITVAEATSFVRKRLGSTAPGGTGTSSYPTLRRGSTGAAVSDLQSRLLNAGHNPGPIDGIFGSGTERAVRSFQAAQGLAVDGIVGPDTWGRLLTMEPGAPNGGGTWGPTRIYLPYDPQLISSPWGPRGSGFHEGIDFRVESGTPVAAVKAGTVARTYTSPTFGETVILYHGRDMSNKQYYTLYAHNSQVLVSDGQRVAQGQPIAYSGNTGRSTGPHVHYEVHVVPAGITASSIAFFNQEYTVDPQKHLWPNLRYP